MACEAWRDKLDAYLDMELRAEEAAALDEHVRACAACAAEALRRVQLKRLTHVAGKRYAPRIEFRQRIEQKLVTRKRPMWLWNSVLPMAAALLIVAFVVINQRGSLPPREHALGELTDLHITSLASANPVDVISSDRHTVKPWFQGKVPFTFNLPDLESTPFVLVGGRVTYFNQAPGAQLIFIVRKHRISVFIFQNRPEWNRPWSAGDAFGKQMSFNAQTWSEGGLRYVVISDANAGDVHKLSELLKSAARS
jgi:anti-sigma factor RsiW